MVDERGVNVLDHGYVQLVETWGSDERIIEAARMSTGKGFLGWGTYESPGDEKLLAYLWDHRHETPFEMAGATFEIKAPIFVFREWHRHRTQSFNEMSARYVPIPDEDYVPTIDRVVSGARNAGANKQAQGSSGITDEDALAWLGELEDIYQHAQQCYERGLRKGVQKELARLCLPVGRYSLMRASANLRNWLGFLRLRQASNAQYEIRVYADAVHDMLVEAFPRTLALFDNGQQ